jgi:hypothetical protein
MDSIFGKVLDLLVDTLACHRVGICLEIPPNLAEDLQFRAPQLGNATQKRRLKSQ